MGGSNLARNCFAAAIVLMPFTSATKQILGLDNLLWIDPTLILGLVLFLAILPRPGVGMSVAVIFVSIVSAAIAVALLPPTGVYDVFREPSRLLLNMIWFWVAAWFVAREPTLALRALFVSVLLQLAVAIWIWLVLMGALPAAGVSSDYLQEFGGKQLIYFEHFSLQRLMGTFVEGPPFGLFMFSALVVFLVASFHPAHRSRTTLAGLLIALGGSLGAVADQVLLAIVVLAVFLAGILVIKSRLIGTVVALVMAIAAVVVVTKSVGDKVAQTEQMTETQVFGHSVGERMWHVDYALDLLSQQPLSLLFGIGPGRYGEYAARSGYFPETVTLQVTPFEWFVEYGAIGGAAILAWLVLIGITATRRFGLIGFGALISLLVANGFQANWKWEAWFFALSFLLAFREQEEQSARRVRLLDPQVGAKVS